jgi:hypothetical protein
MIPFKILKRFLTDFKIDFEKSFSEKILSSLSFEVLQIKEF